jgi:hypothetical protein
MPNLKHSPDGSMGIQGKDLGAGGFIPVTCEYNASSVDKTFFVADRAYRIVGIRGIPDVAGTDGGAVTATIRKAASAVALASGTAVHSGTYNLKGTVITNQTLTLSTTAGALDIAAGDRLCIDFTGTLTSATGAITVSLAVK